MLLSGTLKGQEGRVGVQHPAFRLAHHLSEQDLFCNKTWAHLGFCKSSCSVVVFFSIYGGFIEFISPHWRLVNEALALRCSGTSCTHCSVGDTCRKACRQHCWERKLCELTHSGACVNVAPVQGNSCCCIGYLQLSLQQRCAFDEKCLEKYFCRCTLAEWQEWFKR